MAQKTRIIATSTDYLTLTRTIAPSYIMVDVEETPDRVMDVLKKNGYMILGKQSHVVFERMIVAMFIIPE